MEVEKFFSSTQKRGIFKYIKKSEEKKILAEKIELTLIKIQSSERKI